MLQIVVLFALALSGANWLLFVGLAIATQRALARARTYNAAVGEPGLAEARARPDKLVEAAGGLASAFGGAGPSASAAAMSLVCLIIAAVVAGADKL